MTSSRSLSRDLIHGALGFALVSVAAFCVWAFAGGWFRGHGGELAMYGAIAAVFLGFSGLILGPLAGGAGRFYRAFLPAFFIYALLWCAAWFALRDKTGEWLGSVIGGVAFAVISMKLLGSTRGWLGAAVVFVILHSAGYFAGDWAMYGYWLDKGRAAQFPGLARPDFMVLAKLSWGLCYGLGFGAGIGYVFHRARLPLEPAAN
jgi:hypothetical protein